MFCHITPICEVLGSSNVVLSLGKTFNQNYLSTVILMKRWLYPDMTEKFGLARLKNETKRQAFLFQISYSLISILVYPCCLTEVFFFCFIIVAFFDMTLCYSSFNSFSLIIFSTSLHQIHQGMLLFSDMA